MSVTNLGTNVILGADTVVVVANDEILGKPGNAGDAREMLTETSGTANMS